MNGIERVENYKPREACRVHTGMQLTIKDGPSGQVQKIEQGGFENELLISILFENKKIVTVIYPQDEPNIFLNKFLPVEN